MKNKIFLLGICFLFLLIPIAISDIEVSLDNTTWIDSSYYITTISSERGEVIISSLEAATLYYFRAKNTTTNWTYTQYRTKGSEEVVGVSLTIIIALGVMLTLAFAFIGLGVYLENSLFNIAGGVILLIAGLIIAVNGFDGIATYFTIGLGTVLIIIAAAITLFSAQELG